MKTLLVWMFSEGDYDWSRAQGTRALYWCRRLASVSETAPTLTFALVQLPGAEQLQDSCVAVECGRHRVRLSTCFDESVMLRIVALLSGQES